MWRFGPICVRNSPRALLRDPRAIHRRELVKSRGLAPRNGSPSWFARGLAQTKKPRNGEAASQPTTVAKISSESSSSGKTGSRKYERKSPIEHVLLRPGMYVGNTKEVTAEMFFNVKANSYGMKMMEVTYIPAVVKLFDEILVNALDNVQRCPKTSQIWVTIDGKKNEFVIENDGTGIPVRLHETENIYIPELVMGHLLTGSNFDDTADQFTGGRHGYGAKLTNIMSTKFKVETLDTTNKRFFEMSWHDHMKPVEPGAIVQEVSQETMTPWNDFTRVTFSPDLSLFGLKTKTVPPQTLAVMRRRVYDTAGILGKKVEVYLNNRLLKIDSFEEYVQRCCGVKKSKMVTFQDDHRTIIVTSSSSGEKFEHLSFVNGMSTDRGGSHVNAVTNDIVSYVVEASKRVKASTGIRPSAQLVKKKLRLFINYKVANPEFDSQTKEQLSTPINEKLPIEFLKTVVSKTSILKDIAAELDQKSFEKLSQATRGSKVGNRSRIHVPKLDDANLAGTKRGHECTLILTEGDSAKALAVAGFSVVGRDKFGVFPLRGKLLNVRDASNMDIGKNKEVTNICQIMGMTIGKDYSGEKEFNTLRYGSIMLMTDQDYDGSHIKGLLINMLHCFWPDLLKRKGFLKEFVTPVIKAKRTKGTQKKSNDPNERHFFTIPEFEAWYNGLPPGEYSKWNIKYYKGLGTSTSAEAKEYFGNLKKHTLDFVWPKDRETQSNTDDIISKAFDKRRAGERKTWITDALQKQSEGRYDYIDHSQDSLSYSDFVDRELVLFSQHDVVRSIPSCIDGLKPSQRKVLFAAFQRGLGKEMKVGQFAGYCAERTAYHHGEQSLLSTIVKMAQDFVGAQNLPLLYPSGQFGTRLQGGKDAAQPRYISTKLQPYTRRIFPEVDDPVLTYNVDDGVEVEPEYYIPIIPMVLVNGSEGIGTGWSTDIPTHNPLDIIRCLEHKLNTGSIDKQRTPVNPWIRGFKGKIEPVIVDNYAKGFFVYGICEQVDPYTLKVSELPSGVWTEDFKAKLTDLEKDGLIESFTEQHSENDVLFYIKGSSTEQVTELYNNRDTMLKLKVAIRTTNMHMFDSKNVIKLYESPFDVIEEFYEVRLTAYEKRRQLQIDTLNEILRKLSNELRFVEMVNRGELTVVKKSKKELEEELRQHNFDPNPSSFDYLLELPLRNFTTDHVAKLQTKHRERSEQLSVLQSSTPEKLWLADLDALKEALGESYA